MTISGKIAKDVFEIVWNEGGDPRAIVETRGLKQVTDVSALEKLVDEIIAIESGQSRRRQDQSEGDRVVRRPSDEGVRRQSQPASGQRSSQEASRHLSATFVGARTCGKFRRARCAHAPSVAKISRSRLPRGVADGLQRHRRSESPAPIRAFCVPKRPPEGLFEPFAAKKFCLGESVTASAFAAAKACACEASCSAREREEQTTTRDKNPQFIGISASHEKQIANARTTENLFDADFAKYRRAFARRRRGAALTHKIKRSHCYFFPAVVIG